MEAFMNKLKCGVVLLSLLYCSFQTVQGMALGTKLRMLSTLGTAAAGLKVAQMYQKEQSQEKQKTALELKDTFKEQDWQQLRQYPLSAALIKKVFDRRGVDPKDYDFRVSNEGAFFNCVKKEFNFNEAQFKNIDRFFVLPAKTKLTNYGNGHDTVGEYIGSIEGVIGHELQHAMDRDDYLKLYDSLSHKRGMICVFFSLIGTFGSKFFQLEGYHKYIFSGLSIVAGHFFSGQIREQDYFAVGRIYETRADIYSSRDPHILRSFARYFEVSYADYLKMFEQKFGKDKAEYYLEENFYKSDVHPHPLERARYLRKLADEFEAEQNKIKEQKRKEQAQEEALLCLHN